MLKNRLIFTLLYADGSFMLSRNFRLQKVGDVRWLQRNYDFSTVAFSIDELIVLDVSRGVRNETAFCDCLKTVAEGCFAPIAAGGGVRNIAQVKQLLRSGADKVVLNTPVFHNPGLISELAAEFGRQCLVASVDVKRTADGDYQIWCANGTQPVEGTLSSWLTRIAQAPIGELYLNSMDRDGTGQGFDLKIIDHIPADFSIPVILAGGAGKPGHLAEGLGDNRIDAVATAHLFNFIGDGLKLTRDALLQQNFVLASWPDKKAMTIGP